MPFWRWVIFALMVVLPFGEVVLLLKPPSLIRRADVKVKSQRLIIAITLGVSAKKARNKGSPLISRLDIEAKQNPLCGLANKFVIFKVHCNFTGSTFWAVATMH